MNFEDINESSATVYNQSVNHPLQAFEWGEFRKKTGVGIIRRGIIKKEKVVNPYQISIHQTPGFSYFIGYFPKGNLPSSELLNELKNMGRSNKLTFIQLEPNVEIGNWKLEIGNSGLQPAFHPLFTKYTFLLDLKKTEDELLKNMHQKTRYNIRLSQKHGVEVKIDNSDKAFKEYIKLTKQTTKRQKFYAHDENYHRLMWETLGISNFKFQISNSGKYPFDPNKLQAHLLTAKYKHKTLVAYILFTFKDTIYYPYGASSDEHREVMASHGAMWEAVRFGKNLGLEKFDMWGAANVPDPKPNDPYFGFHRFKQGFGAELIEFVGSYDLVINPLNYRLLTIADKLRWAYLRAKKRQ
ncbi:MAG: peptidoglycan bridge formation glycyltransferase FemA/FemB family protein [Candidatus Levybacteria bacterium]|nr:peptidoglycan bridge formation glycyltransferase FemA/FemB family protein [Candidatus Levybacteria bacterium]